MYVRLSLMTPRHGQDRTVAEMMDALVDYYARQPGFIAGYKVLSAEDGGGDAGRVLGRITVWRSMEEADAVAQSNHVMSLRSDLMPSIEEGSHEERGFHATGQDEPLANLVTV
jgi:hypothetical protein